MLSIIHYTVKLGQLLDSELLLASEPIIFNLSIFFINLLLKSEQPGDREHFFALFNNFLKKDQSYLKLTLKQTSTFARFLLFGLQMILTFVSACEGQVNIYMVFLSK